MPIKAEPLAAALVEEHGLERAKAVALIETLQAQQSGDFYALSVWREVRRILAEKEASSGNPEMNRNAIRSQDGTRNRM